MALEDDQRDFVGRAMQRTGWSITELARRAGLNHSTLSRFMKSGRDGHVLRQRTIRQIEQASGLIFGTLPLPGPAPRQALGFAEAEASPLRPEAGDPMGELVQAAIGGRNTYDPWLLRSRALEGLGYRPGDVLIVALGETPRPGDVVCAQVYDWSRGTAETLFRLYQPPCLVAVTGEASLLRPFIVDDAATAIKGVVVTQLRGRSAA